MTPVLIRVITLGETVTYQSAVNCCVNKTPTQPQPLGAAEAAPDEQQAAGIVGWRVQISDLNPD